MTAINIPIRDDNDKAIVKKIKSVKSNDTKIKKFLNKLDLIHSTVNEKLGKYKGVYIIINSKDELNNYIKTAINNKIIAIDTETTGLNPILDKIVGLCLYTPGLPGAYIPINHINYLTKERLSSQLTESDVAQCIKKLELNIAKIVMFNAKFDIRVIRNQLGIYLTCYWDCYLAARLLNENEPVNKLKPLHQKYVLNDAEDEFTFDELFNGISFDNVPIDDAYLYAAHDPVITYELYDFQKDWLSLTSSRDDLRKVAEVFFNIEMPCVNVTADMEDTGILFDKQFANKLHDKYYSILQERENQFHIICNNYKDKISLYSVEHPGILDEPINIKSSKQLSILLYDILKLKGPIDKKTKLPSRSTAKDVLEQLRNNEIVESILNYREFATIVNTFIDKLPKVVFETDGRIHCNFNQYGADTGRFSSSDPNLQNIPSHNKEIRKMFKATDGYIMMSSDYSQQEPKVMTQMCGDPKMIQAYQEGKDLYAEIAALSFNTTYDNCLEFRPDGTTNKEGKERRSQAKSILLGVLYGRGVPSIAEQLGTTTERAQKIKDSVFKGFPAIPKFERDSLNMAYELGYVTTLWGRKRRLPDLQLDEFEFRWNNTVKLNDDVINYNNYDLELPEVPKERQRYYLKKLSKCWYSEKKKIFEEANQEGIWIIDNGMKIADAQRQCVNARIQGSAADMSKLAMIKVGNDQRLKELGFRLLVPIHDELLAECPIENAKECKERFAKLMSEAAADKLTIPIKCDVACSYQWYGDEVDV